MYVPRKEVGRVFAKILNSVDASIQRLEDYTEKRAGILITVTRNNIDKTSINRTKITEK